MQEGWSKYLQPLYEGQEPHPWKLEQSHQPLGRLLANLHVCPPIFHDSHQASEWQLWRLSMKTDTTECHAIMWYLKKKGLRAKVTQDMDKSCGEDAPSHTTVKKQSAESRRGRDSVQDDPCPERLVTAASQEVIARICDQVMADWQLSTGPTASTLDISHPHVLHILTRQGEVTARWVPTLLTHAPKWAPFSNSCDNLKILTTFWTDWWL